MNEQLREALAEVVRRWWGPGAAHPQIVREFAEIAEAEGRRRAAEELRDRAAMILTRAAEEDEDVDAALTETAAWLAARAAALAPENARPE